MDIDGKGIDEGALVSKPMAWGRGEGQRRWQMARDGFAGHSMGSEEMVPRARDIAVGKKTKG